MGSRQGRELFAVHAASGDHSVVYVSVDDEKIERGLGASACGGRDEAPANDVEQPGLLEVTR